VLGPNPQVRVTECRGGLQKRKTPFRNPSVAGSSPAWPTNVQVKHERMAPAGGGDVAESDRDPLSDAVTEPSGWRSSHRVPRSTPARRARLSSSSAGRRAGADVPPAA